MSELFRRLGYYFAAAVFALFLLCIAGGILIIMVISVREWIQDFRARKRRRSRNGRNGRE